MAIVTLRIGRARNQNTPTHQNIGCVKKFNNIPNEVAEPNNASGTVAHVANVVIALPGNFIRPLRYVVRMSSPLHTPYRRVRSYTLAMAGVAHFYRNNKYIVSAP